MNSDATTIFPASLPGHITKYFPYLLEIRKRLLFAVSLFVTASIIGFVFYERIITFILDFFSLKGVNIVFTTPFQFFTLALNCSLVVGVVITIPVLIYQLLSFLKPALLAKEYRLVVTIMPLALVLFVGGFIYGVTMMKYVVQIFYATSLKLQIGNILDVETFLSNILITGLLMGIAFLFPIVITILMQLKLVKHRSFVKQRPLAYIIGIIFVILLPPPDIMSDLILFAPLVLLFELTLILNRVFLRR